MRILKKSQDSGRSFSFRAAPLNYGYRNSLDAKTARSKGIRLNQLNLRAPVIFRKTNMTLIGVMKRMKNPHTDAGVKICL